MTANFDSLARLYRWLERLAFGRDLERARFCHLNALRDRNRILILGEGDGRFLERLLKVNQNARIVCVDASARMLAEAARRSVGDAPRLTFRKADALQEEWGESRYDAVVTLFFLDCFTADELKVMIAGLRRAMSPAAIWLWADFVVPPSGWQRFRARIWLFGLYTAFGWMTGLKVRALPPSEEILLSSGLRAETSRSFQAGILKATVFI